MSEYRTSSSDVRLAGYQARMPRKPNSIEPGAAYHLISRFVAQEWFVRSQHEREQYLRLFGLAIARSDWRCFAFAVMSNHIHLGVRAGEVPLADWLREAHGPFAEWINGRLDRIGAVFVRGPKAVRARGEEVARMIGYIHHNPVRAGVVAHPADSDWTSHRAYVALTSTPSWLDVDLGLELAGFTSGDALDRWIHETAVERQDLTSASLDPMPRRGRPPKQVSRWLQGAVVPPSLVRFVR